MTSEKSVTTEQRLNAVISTRLTSAISANDYTGTSTLTNLPGVSAAVLTGVTYRIHGMLVISMTGTGGVNIGNDNSASTSMVRLQWLVTIVANAGASIIGTNSQTSLVHYTTPSLTGGSIYTAAFDGIVTFSASGTLNVQTSAAVAYKILAGSFMDIVTAPAPS